MSSKLKLDDLPSPDKLETVDSLPAPKQLDEIKEPGKLESLARGGAQGLTFGLADELAGAMENPIGALQQAGEYLHLTDANTPQAEEYRAARDESRQAYQAAEEANPITSGVGNIAGSILPAILTLGASAPVAGAGLATKALQAAKAGAGAGAAFGIGQDTEEELSPLSVARNAAAGAVTGAALPVLGAGAKGLHELGKAKSTTYEELARIMGKTAGGMKLLGTEAKDEALKKFKAASDTISEDLSKARDVVGGKVSQVKSEEPAKDILSVLQSLKSGVTGAAEKKPVMSKVVPNIEKVQSKIDELAAQHQNRLSEQTKKLIDLREKARSAISTFSPDKRSNIQSQIAKTEATISKLQDGFTTKISKLQDQKSKLLKDAVSEPRTEAVYGSKESEDAAKQVLDMINRVEQRSALQGEDLSQASPKVVEELVSNLKNISPAGQAPLKSPEILQQAETARKAIKGLDSEALQQAKQQYSKLAEADELLTGRSRDFLNKDKLAREDAVFKKMIQAAKDNQTSDIRNMQLAEQAKLLQEAGQGEIAEKVTGLAKSEGQNYIDALRVNPKNLHENIVPKAGAFIGETLASVKDATGKVSKMLTDNKMAGPILQKLDDTLIQNKYSQHVIDTVRKALSTQDENKRKAAVNVMLQSPTYRKLIKDLAIPGIEDGEQTK